MREREELVAPPMLERVVYSALNIRLRDEYQGWVEQDIRSGRQQLRATFAWGAFMVAAVTIPSAFVGDLDWWDVLPVGIGFAIGTGFQLLYRRGRPLGHNEMLALRFHRGEITRREMRDEFLGPFDWKILALAVVIVAILMGAVVLISTRS